jgi:hypothetical protein
MMSIQRLRALAHSAGNLVTNEQQQVDVDGDYINIVPAQPQYIYIPTYDPYMAFFGPAPYYGFYPGIIFFGSPFPIGAWLNHDCDWHGHRIYYHGWRGGGWIARSRPIIRITNIYVNSRYANIQINRNIIHRQVNYSNLNRYSSIHRDVNYDNLIRDKRADTGKANAGNKVIRRNMDVSDPRLDVYHGRAPAPEAAVREKQPPPAQTRPEPRQPIPAPPSRPPQVVRPAPQQAPPAIQRAPNTAFGTGGGGFDPRATSQRGQESRARVSPPPTGRPTTAPPAPAARPIPSAPGRR